MLSEVLSAHEHTGDAVTHERRAEDKEGAHTPWGGDGDTHGGGRRECSTRARDTQADN